MKLSFFAANAGRACACLPEPCIHALVACAHGVGMHSFERRRGGPEERSACGVMQVAVLWEPLCVCRT